MLATKTRDEAPVRHKTPARRKAPKTFAQLRDALNAAAEAYDAAQTIQSKAEAALFAFKDLHGDGYEQADGYAEIAAAADRAAALADKPCHAHVRATDRIVAFPTLAPDELAFKRALVAEFSGVCSDDPALAFISSTMEALRTARVCRPDPAIARAWDEAMARYREAQAAVAFQKEVSASLYIEPEIPECLRAPSLHYSVVCRWQREEHLIDDLLITPAAKAELLPILREHLLKPEGRLRLVDPEDKAAIEADEEAIEILDDVLWEAEKMLMEIPAPDVAAMAWKAAMVARESDGDKFGFADLGMVAYHASDCAYPECGQVAQYIDLLRLSDPDSPLLQMPAFSPSAWIKAYGALGGVVSYTPTGMIIVFPEEDTPAAAELRAELAETPWKYRAAEHRAENRAYTGGDPYFASGGRYEGDRARRAPRFLSPTQPADRALRVSFVTIDGAPAPVVEEIVNPSV